MKNKSLMISVLSLTVVGGSMSSLSAFAEESCQYSVSGLRGAISKNVSIDAPLGHCVVEAVMDSQRFADEKRAQNEKFGPVKTVIKHPDLGVQVLVLE